MTVVVWSERPEPNASGLRDCTYSAGLQGLVHGGFTKFPLGIYTVAEREALERSDSQPDETGASLADLVVAVKRRYGLTLVERTSGLSTALTHVGSAIIMQGSNINLPASHIIRRWDPGFTGGHCVTVVVRAQANDPLLWLDPEAPNKYVGDNISVATALLWARGWGRFIEIKADEFKPVVAPPPPVYTQAQWDAVQAQLTTAKADLTAASAKIEKALADLA